MARAEHEATPRGNGEDDSRSKALAALMDKQQLVMVGCASCTWHCPLAGRYTVSDSVMLRQCEPSLSHSESGGSSNLAQSCAEQKPKGPQVVLLQHVWPEVGKNCTSGIPCFPSWRQDS